MLRLLNLTQPIQDMLIQKKIDVGHARVLVVFMPEEQETMANTMVVKKMSVRAAKRFTQIKRQAKEIQGKTNTTTPKLR